MATLYDELLKTLKAVDSGQLYINMSEEMREAYHTNVTFTTSNNWKITVFVDGYSGARDWDYIDNAISPDGNVLDFDSILNSDHSVSTFRPNNFRNWW